ncbi:unnamed protein product [Spirodela intermedia]|uniref:Uncharacterized protein n=1 Tax=Spirodela intermedia TaxID=51605 RepID=A0A7I8JAR7_SPIIN|nr:unnamed protein product [Spirodela intermedia]CAA6667296.1 unnamed protein product [Spirodela intermedia]
MFFFLGKKIIIRKLWVEAGIKQARTRHLGIRFT